MMTQAMAWNKERNSGSSTNAQGVPLLSERSPLLFVGQNHRNSATATSSEPRRRPKTYARRQFPAHPGCAGLFLTSAPARRELSMRLAALRELAESERSDAPLNPLVGLRRRFGRFQTDGGARVTRFDKGTPRPAPLARAYGPRSLRQPLRHKPVSNWYKWCGCGDRGLAPSAARDLCDRRRISPSSCRLCCTVQL